MRASALFLLLLLPCISTAFAAPPLSGQFFRIQVVDQDTGRGVPLVELRTVNNIRLYTDSAGMVAFHEPGLMNTEVFFHVRSHGYQFIKDGFGNAGKRLKTTPGGQAQLKIKRVNIAQRLYRMTGAGIYRDSVLLGDTPPTDSPLLNGRVFGSDSVVNALYRGKIYWFWGDTNKPEYPLGNFHVPGATSLLPAAGGLDPNVGVNLSYFVREDGFAKETARLPGAGPTWIDGLISVKNNAGQPRLIAKYVKVKPPLEIYERGLVEFDDKTQQFVGKQTLPLDAPLQPTGHPLIVNDGDQQYVYIGHPFPHVRVPATVEAVRDLSQYQAWTCLKAGSDPDNPQFDRAADGSLRFAWKSGTPPLVGKLRQRLVREQKLRSEEGLIQLRDVETGSSIAAHGGSVYFNPYRNRWIAIILESFGTSLLGELWYAEADTPLGPWVYARKIVTHEKYSFYNPKQHPMFDQREGRTIYFEGTYTNMFSGNPDQTPRYNYNQIMYRLDLDDPRLNLPVAIYETTGNGDAQEISFVTGDEIRPQQRHGRIAWFALNRPSNDCLPIFVDVEPDGSISLAVGRNADGPGGSGSPLCYALPADLADPPSGTEPLYEFTSRSSQQRRYATGNQLPIDGYQRAAEPLCLVWESPIGELPETFLNQ